MAIDIFSVISDLDAAMAGAQVYDPCRSVLERYYIDAISDQAVPCHHYTPRPEAKDWLETA
ncbi:MAG: hypothetical protein P0107_02920 [Nitrosomonas sp.]|nr:hypothetical protein [Nitrosomonas sp.]